MTEETATADELKAEIRKLSAQATALKMDLHDLSEELPVNWERIPDLALKTFFAFQALNEARKRLAALG
ncbi:MAG TPA: CCE_0567 family metalloprotein [Burkholderiales bacterium]